MATVEPDLSICILSVGSPQLAYAVQSVAEQTIEVSHRIVRDKHPVAAAFNEMLGSCDTLYVIQLDEDMELFPNSAEKMLAKFKAAEQLDPSIAQMTFRLSDPVLGSILGVKLLAVEKAGQLRMNATQFSDRDFNQKMLDHGYATVIDKGDPVGWHARHRTDYEHFIKHAISASKLARPRTEEPPNSDVRRLFDLIMRTESLDFEEALMMLGGVYWGLFNEVRTDVNTYPTEQYNNLKNIIAPLCEFELSQKINDLIERSNTIIIETAATEVEPVFYVKQKYYGQPLRTIVEQLYKSSAAVWDLMGFGYGEIAVVLHEHRKLRAIYIDSSSIDRLKNSVTAKLSQATDYCEPAEVECDEVASSGIVIPYGTQYSQKELETLLVQKYAHALVDLQKLELCGVDKNEFIYRMEQVHGWRAEPDERGVVYLRSNKV